MTITIRTVTFAAALAACSITAVPGAVAAPEPAAEQVVLSLTEAVAALPVAAEDRTGYSRDAFRHWTDADRDGCSTRAEVLLEEAVTAPEVTGRCSLAGGRWHSWYDDVAVDNARNIDIDHMVPLAEAWDSGASGWSASEREAFANDLGDPRSLVAVTARSNRSKSDQDPAEWMVPDTSSVCRYVADWTAVKTRWGLNVDSTERAALTDAVAGCEDVELRVNLAR